MKKLACVLLALLAAFSSVGALAYGGTHQVFTAVKNGRIYAVIKVQPTVEYEGDDYTTDVVAFRPVTQVNPYIYKLTRVGYLLALVQNPNTTRQKYLPLAQLDSESVVYNPETYPYEVGKEIDGVGQILGMEAILLEEADSVAQVLAAERLPVYMSAVGGNFITPDGEPAFTEERLALLKTALNDFGLAEEFGMADAPATPVTPETEDVTPPDGDEDVADATVETVAP